MQYFCSALWGCLTLTSMLCTIKYYLPYILAKLQNAACAPDGEQTFETREPSAELKTADWLCTLEKNRIMLISGTIYGLICGYFVGKDIGFCVQYLEMTVVFLILSVVFVTDLAYHIIPNLMPLTIICVRACVLIGQLLLHTQYAGRNFRNSIVAMLLITAVLLIVCRITHGGMGFGDVKLISAIGFMGGMWNAVYTSLFSFFACMIASTFLLLMKKKTMKDTIPLGPFIWIGYGLALILNRL